MGGSGSSARPACRPATRASSPRFVSSACVLFFGQISPVSMEQRLEGVVERRVARSKGVERWAPRRPPLGSLEAAAVAAATEIGCCLGAFDSESAGSRGSFAEGAGRLDEACPAATAARRREKDTSGHETHRQALSVLSRHSRPAGRVKLPGKDQLLGHPPVLRSLLLDVQSLRAGAGRRAWP